VLVKGKSAEATRIEFVQIRGKELLIQNANSSRESAGLGILNEKVFPVILT
jgi:hypothetical protein